MSDKDIKDSAAVAAQVVADAAEVAADRISYAAKSAADSASSAAATQFAAGQVLGAVAISRLDSMSKQFDSHEALDRERFAALTDGQKDVKIELKGDIRDLSIDLKKQTRTITLITGGIITASTVINIAVGLLVFLHHG